MYGHEFPQGHEKGVRRVGPSHLHVHQGYGGTDEDDSLSFPRPSLVVGPGTSQGNKQVHGC
jgi:hypothetical protein